MRSVLYIHRIESRVGSAKNRQFEQIGLLAQEDNPFDPQIIADFAKQTTSVAFKHVYANNELSRIQAMVAEYLLDPTTFSKQFDNISIPRFDFTMNIVAKVNYSQSILTNMLKSDYTFDLERGELLTQGLLHYQTHDFIRKYQTLFGVNNNKNLRPDLIDFTADFIRSYLATLDPNNALQWQNNVNQFIQNVDLNSTWYVQLQQAITQKREKTMAPAIYQHYCQNIKSSHAKDIYVRLGKDHIDNIKKKLATMLGNKAIVDTTKQAN
ncbi:MAG: hypothetical protein R3A45_01675 [Bdellovibrionota bacterium]